MPGTGQYANTGIDAKHPCFGRVELESGVFTDSSGARFAPQLINAFKHTALPLAAQWNKVLHAFCLTFTLSTELLCVVSTNPAV